MALSLDTGPPDGTFDTDVALELRVSAAPVAAQEAVKHLLPPVVLCVPEIDATDLTIKPSRRIAVEQEEPTDAAQSVRDDARSSGSSPRAQLVEAWRSIDWTQVGQWVTRPVVTYSAAAMIAVIIVAAIVGHSRNSTAPVTSQPPVIADGESGSPLHQHDASDESSGLDTPPVDPHSQPTNPPHRSVPKAPGEIVKLPPVENQGVVLPWRREPAGGFSTTAALSNSERAPSFATPRDEMARLSPGRSSGSPTERPNVARLEGRIDTPKLSR